MKHLLRLAIIITQALLSLPAASGEPVEARKPKRIVSVVRVIGYVITEKTDSGTHFQDDRKKRPVCLLSSKVRPDKCVLVRVVLHRPQAGWPDYVRITTKPIPFRYSDTSLLNNVGHAFCREVLWTQDLTGRFKGFWLHGIHAGVQKTIEFEKLLEKLP